MTCTWLSPIFFLRRRNRNPDGKKENEPKPSHFKRSRRVDDSHEVSCSCTVTVPCSFWLDQLAGPSSISTLPGSTMRVDNHGRSPESHCWPGLSDSVEQTMAAKEICVCQCKCSVSIAWNWLFGFSLAYLSFLLLLVSRLLRRRTCRKRLLLRTSIRLRQHGCLK